MGVFSSLPGFFMRVSDDLFISLNPLLASSCLKLSKAPSPNFFNNLAVLRFYLLTLDSTQFDFRGTLINPICSTKCFSYKSDICFAVQLASIQVLRAFISSSEYLGC